MGQNSNQTQAQLTFKRVVSSRLAIAVDAAPSGAAAGHDVDGWNVFSFTRHHTANVTSSEYVLWFYDGVQWFQKEVSTSLDAADYDNTTVAFQQSYDVRGILRVFVQVSGIVVDGSDPEITIAANKQA